MKAKKMEDAAEQFARLYDNGTCDGIAQDCFIAGAEWQKTQMMKSPLVSIGNTASEELQRINYENGKKDMKEQMMKDAVECVVYAGKEGNKWIVSYIGDYESMVKTCMAGEKVRIIIEK